MELLDGIRELWIASLYWWVGFCVAFLVLSRFCPCNPGQNWWTAPRSAITDCVYWLLTPLVGQLGRMVFLVVGVMVLYGDGATPEFAARGWPLWCQCIVILLLQDVIMYWIHRIFHTRFGWRFHLVHHSPEILDWTSARRFHPVNIISEFVFVDVVALLLGFSPMALAILGPFHLIYSMMVHANLNWTFGPFRYLIASPVFHRWHHTTEREGLDRNFASTFPFLDYWWGTFYMPAGRRPEVYGANESELPVGYVGQTLFPFRGTGRWILRHPIFTTACALASVALGYRGWHELTRYIELQELEMRSVDPLETPPELSRLSSNEVPKVASAVITNAAGSSVIYGMGDGSVFIRDVGSDRERKCERHAMRVNSLAICPNGLLAASAGGDGFAKVFQTENGSVIRSLSHDGNNVMSVAVSDDGWVATGTIDGTIWLWDSDGRLAKKKTLQTGSIHAIAISNSGKQVVAAQSSNASMWDVTSDTLTACQGIKDLAYCVSIRQDGQSIAAGEFDGRLIFWDLGRDQPRLIATDAQGPIYSLMFTPDGNAIVSGGADRIVRIWNAETGKVLKKLDGHSGLVFAVSYDVARQRILAAGKDLAVTAWKFP